MSEQIPQDNGQIDEARVAAYRAVERISAYLAGGLILNDFVKLEEIGGYDDLVASISFYLERALIKLDVGGFRDALLNP